MSDVQLMYGKPFKFNPGNHSYYFDGKRIPSVTAIIGRLDKPGLVYWSADMAVKAMREQATEDQHGNLVINPDALSGCARAFETARDKGADKGKAAHRYAEARLLGQSIDLPEGPDARMACIAFDKWLKHAEGRNFRSLDNERRICSQEHFYAGTLDNRAAYYNEIAVIDFKTTGGIYDSHWLQLEGYRVAFEEETGECIQAKYVVRLCKDTGEFEEERKPVSDIHRDAWLSLVAHDKAMRRFKEVK